MRHNAVACGKLMQTRAPLSAWYAIAILSVAVLYAVIDRQVLMLLAQPLKANLQLSDTQIGSLQGVGAALFAAIAVVPLGWLADRVDRRLVLAGCILVWSVAIASCGFATGYWGLLLCVAFLAAGEAGLSPVVFSMIPDLFPERQRMTANFIYYAATILGSGAGIALAGAIVDHIGLFAPFFPNGLLTRETWRLVFVVVAVPGPFLVLAILAIRLKPRAAPAEPAAAAFMPQEDRLRAQQERSKLLDHLALNWKAIVGVFAPYGLALMGSVAVFTWLPVILMRDFALSPSAVGAGLGSAFIVGSVVGLAIVAVIANYLRSKWGDATPVRLSQIGYFLYALLSPLYLFARSPNEIFLIATILMAIGVGGNSLMPTLLQNLAPGKLRGRVFAISTVIATLFQVISPIAVGLLSDHLFAQPGGLLKAAVVVCAPAFFVASITLWLSQKQILSTVERVRAIPEAA
ncbi:MFS transporter [Sphingopyxis panaciterrae]